MFVLYMLFVALLNNIIMLFLLLNNNSLLLFYSLAKPPPAKKKKEDGMLQLPEDQATVSFPLGPERKEWNVVVPKQHVTAWQSITDISSQPYQSLQFLSKSHRILNGGSPPQIMYKWLLDPQYLSVALLHETSLRRSPNDYGLAVQFLPTLLRTLPLFQSDKWKKATPSAICSEWNKMANKFDIDITTPGKGAVVVDYDEVAFIYRSKNFVRDNADAVSAMVGNNDNKTAFGRPPCNHGGCTKESVTRGFCKRHLPKVRMYLSLLLYIILVSIV